MDYIRAEPAEDCRPVDDPPAGWLKTCVLPPREYPNRESYDLALANLVASFAPELVVLAGFMRILTPNFIDR